ncbi:MAG TPA: DinB family protein [Chloroflexota bacterium]|nr:DinB family protein [Chloroflexota bacterium]
MDEHAISPLALAILSAAPATLRALLDGLPDEVLHAPNPEGWSIKDVVAHLHDTEGIAFTERITRILDEDQPFIRSIDPPARLRQYGYGERTLGELLDDLAARRQEHVAWLRTLSAGQLQRTGQHDTAGPITPAEIIHQWAYHDLAHTRQIMEMAQAHLVDGMGSTRTFYPEAQVLWANSSLDPH